MDPRPLIRRFPSHPRWPACGAGRCTGRGSLGGGRRLWCRCRTGCRLGHGKRRKCRPRHARRRRRRTSGSDRRSAAGVLLQPWQGRRHCEASQSGSAHARRASPAAARSSGCRHAVHSSGARRRTRAPAHHRLMAGTLRPSSHRDGTRRPIRPVARPAPSAFSCRRRSARPARRVLLGHFIELADRTVHLTDLVLYRLRRWRHADLADDVGHPLHRADDLDHRGAGPRTSVEPLSAC